MLILKLCVAIAGVLALFVAAAVTFGAFLPVAHQVSKSRTFSVSQTQLWDSAVAVFHHTNNGSYEILESDRPHRFVTGVIGKNLPFGGTWTYELVGNDRETTLTITERGQVYNPFFRFMSRFILGYYGSIDSFFASLKAEPNNVEKS